MLMTRRRLLTGLAVLPLLAACGGAEAPTAAPAKPTEAPKPAAAGAATSAPAANAGSAPAATKPAAAAAATSAPSAAQPAAKTSGPVSLTWDTFRGVGTPYPDELIKTFKAKQPNITIEFRPLPTSQTDSYPKLYAMYAAGQVGDLYSFDPVDYEFYRAVPQGLTKALDDYIAADKYDPKQYFDTYWDLQKLNGKVWGLPSWGHPGDGGMVVNEVALGEAGLKVPDYASPSWTMDAFYDYAVKLHKASGGQVQRYGVILGTAMRHLTCIGRGFNAELISEDGKKSLISDPAAVKALKWFNDLATKEKVVALPGSFQGSTDALFASGKAGIHQAGALAMFNTRDLIKDKNAVKLKAILFPKRPDGKYASQTRGGTWQVGSKSKAPDAAWEFVKHQSSREGCLLFTKLSKSSVSPVRPDVLDDDFFKEPNFEPYKETLLKGMPNTVPANARGTELQDAFAQSFAPIYLGKVGFDQGVKDLNDAVQRVLDKPTT